MKRARKEIILTERELNGLLNENTTFGKSVSFELATNAIHARVETDLDPDLPIVGGKRLKARARFLVGDAPGTSEFRPRRPDGLGDFPAERLARRAQGQDLLGEVLGGKNGKVAGVEEFKSRARAA